MNARQEVKLVVCSSVLAVALWGMSYAYTYDIRIQPAVNGQYQVIQVSGQPDRTLEIFRQSTGRAVDTEWANVRGAVDTEWA